MIEAIKAADLYLELDNKMNNKDKKEISDLIAKIEETSEIKRGKDYKIIPKNNMQQATITDNKAGITINIRIDENNKLIIEDSTGGNGGDIIDETDKKPLNDFKLSIKMTLNSIEVKPYSIIVNGNTIDNEDMETAEKYKDIKGYQFQLKNEDGTEKTAWLPEELQTQTSFEFTVTEHNIEIEKTYKVSMRAIDLAGNPIYATNNDTEIFFSLIGAYVNYNAGNWTEEDFNKITASLGNPTVNKIAEYPTVHGQFGGFEINQSRNSNAIQRPFTASGTTYSKPRTEGWRVWKIDKDNGEITLISAGNPEAYYHVYAQNNGTQSANILQNRDCSMYENEYAKPNSAKILTGEEAADWYNTQYNTHYTLAEKNVSNSTFYKMPFTTAKPIDVLENGSYYWLGTASSSNGIYMIVPNNRYFYRRIWSFKWYTCFSYSKC